MDADVCCRSLVVLLILLTSGDVQSGEEETQGKPHSSPQLPESRLWPGGDGFFYHVSSESIRRNDLKRNQEKFRLNIRLQGSQQLHPLKLFVVFFSVLYRYRKQV